MKKICFITTVKETLSAFVIDTACYLHAEGGWDISFICSPDAEFEQSLPDFIHFHGVKMSRGINAEGLRCVKEIYKILKKEKFDLVQYSTPNASCYAAIAAFLAGVKVRLYCQWGIVFVGMKGARRFIFNLIERMVCFLSTSVEPDSFGNLTLCREKRIYGEKKSRVVGNGSACGVDLTRFDISKKGGYRAKIRSELGIPDDAPVFGFCGRLTRDKGINIFLNTAFALLDEREDCRFLILGDEEAGSGADATLMEKARADGRFHFVGFRRHVEEYMSAMDVYLLPSAREGFGMTVIEAGAMELPVIAYRIPGPMESIVDRKTGILVDFDENITDAARSLLCDVEKRRSLGCAARVRVCETYERQRLLSEILADREKLIGEKK